MPLVTVKAAPGRTAVTAPRGGRDIPSDRFITIERTPFIDRLIRIHGDLIVKDDKPAAAAAAAPTTTAKAKG